MADEVIVRDARRGSGRPWKYKDGYCNVVKVIRILEETFLQWRQLKSEKNLPDDDSVARYLLKSAHDRAIFDASKFDQLYLSFVAI